MRQHDTRKLNINFSLSSSHSEVVEGNTFTITLAISGPDARAGLQIPFRIIGTVILADYLPNEEYGLFTIGDDLTATLTFTAMLDYSNELDLYFILALHYYPIIQQTVTIKNTYMSFPPKPAEPIPNPPTFEITLQQSEVIGGNEAIFYITYYNMRPGVKLRYFIQSNMDQYPKEDYFYSEPNGISEIKITTSSTPIRRLLRIWLKNHPKIQNQIFITPPA